MGNKKLLAIALFVMVFASFSHAKESDVLEFKTYSYDLLAKHNDMSADDFLSGDGTHRIYGNFILPVKINTYDIAPLRNTLIEYAGVESDANGKFMPKISEGLTIINKDPKLAKPSTEEYVDLNIVCLNSDMAIWECNAYEYMGGAHGIGVLRYINYSIQLNKILTLDDIFVAGFQAKLNKLIRQNIKDKHLEELYSDEGIDKIEYPETFRITGNGIEFVYDPYEIGPYSSGFIKVELYAWELIDAGLLKTFAKDLFHYE